MVKETYLGKIDMDRLDEAVYYVNRLEAQDRLSPHGRMIVSGCRAYADWIAHDRALAPVFAQKWSEATGRDWSGLSPRKRAEVLAYEESSHFRADLDLVFDDFPSRMIEAIGEASLRSVDL